MFKSHDTVLEHLPENQKRNVYLCIFLPDRDVTDCRRGREGFICSFVCVWTTSYKKSKTMNLVEGRFLFLYCLEVYEFSTPNLWSSLTCLQLVPGSKVKWVVPCIWYLFLVQDRSRITIVCTTVGLTQRKWRYLQILMIVWVSC